MEKRHVKIHINGRVQGVFFRSSAREEALSLGLTGFARNEDDGSVYIEVEGEDNSINKFIEWCKDGPAHAEVNNVEHSSGDFFGFSGFDVY